MTGKSTPIRDREVPRRDTLVDYNYAVAGHAGTMCDADGELFIKPCTKPEVDFYESARALHPEFSQLMPTYIGTLSLNEGADEAQVHAQIPELVEHAQISAELKEDIQSHLHLEERRNEKHQNGNQKSEKRQDDNVTWVPNNTRKIPTDRAVVLENASFGFSRPNIMDAKLGYRLWADDAPLEKRKRFEKIAEETTHKTHGFRIAGMRVFQGADESELDEEQYKIYDKNWGRDTVNSNNLADSIRKFIFNEKAGIDEELGKVVAGAFATDVRRVQEVLENVESQMFSSSLLFVFEGDGDALRRAIQAHKDASVASAAAETAEVVEVVGGNDRRTTARVVEFSNPRIDSGIGMDDEELVKEVENAASFGAEINFSDLGDDDDESCFSSLPEIYSLKLIDFAHAKWRPGQGPDENALKGVRALAEIFEKLSE